MFSVLNADFSYMMQLLGMIKKSINESIFEIPNRKYEEYHNLDLSFL